jgi:MoaA/NifB/PqqE/SkfB family radical SAM enzyme
MEREKVIWKLFGKKLLSYKKLETGEIVSTGFLNPIVNRFRLIMMTFAQANFYKKYKGMGEWRGKRVANTFAPPVGSGAMYRAMKAIFKGSFFRHPYPIAMTFAVTYKCQCNCVHCSAGKHQKKGILELTTEEAKNVIDQSTDLGIAILAFTGGEPLLRSDIFELISYVNKKKIAPIMFTNGQYLTDENVEKLAEAGLYSLFVSIDSPYPEEHDKLRGMPGLYEIAIEGVKKAKAKGIFVGLSSYATRSSTEKEMYKKIHALAKELELHNVMLFDGVPTGNMLKNTSEVLTMPQREEIRAFSQDLFDREIIPPLSSQSWQNSIESYIGGIGCLAAHIQYYVSAYGEVTPCDFAPLSFGNIRDEPLKKIWKRMVHHPAYNHKSTYCRMQNAKFRHFYIDPIPNDASLPYDINKLPIVDYRKELIPEETQLSLQP